jgi:hypothetical protein
MEDQSPTDVGDEAPIERIEWMAERAHHTIREALPDDRAPRSELREVVATISALQAEMAEWSALQHRLHELLAAFGPFYARATSLEPDDLSASTCQALLQSWRLCQVEIGMLSDFATDVEHIGRPFRRDEQNLRGERWVVEPIALQRLLEDALKEERPSPGSIIELTEVFNSVCQRYLGLADRKLRDVVGKLQRVSTPLLEGIE